MTDQLPYTLDHPDPDSAITLTIDAGQLTLQDAFESVHMPLGDLTPEEAARMARAMLAAAGGTGHIVVSTEESARAIRIRESVAAESMREWAIDAARQAEEHPLYPISPRAGVVEAIRALPLLDDGTEGTDTARYRDCEGDPVTDDDTEAQDGARATLRADPAPTPLPSWITVTSTGYACEGPDGKCDTAKEGPFVWSVAQTAEGHLYHFHHGWDQPKGTTVHVATPEGITPCGHGHHDVTTTALIREATCVECLRALAQVNSDTWPEDDERLGCGPHCKCSKPASAGLCYRSLLVSELLGTTVDDAAEELADDPAGTWERAYAAWTNHRRDAATRTNTRFEERLDALEGLTRSMAELVEGHSADLSQARAAIRGLEHLARRPRPYTANTDH